MNEELRRQINTGTLPIPLTKDGCYDFNELAKTYREAGYYPVWFLSISQTGGK